MNQQKELQDVLAEIKAMGVTQTQMLQIMDIASVQSIQHAINDLKKTAPDDEFTAIESLFKEKIEDQQVLKQNIDTLFNRTYGNLAQNRKIFLLIKYLKEYIQLVKQTVELGKRYTQGDPEVIQMIEDAKKNPLFDELVSKMKNSLPQ